MKTWIKKTLLMSALGVVCGAGLLCLTPVRAYLLSRGPSSETLGYYLAREQGCFHCHGSWGQGGISNPGGGKIPSFQGMNFLMAIKNEQDLVAWIMEGSSAEARRDPLFEESKKKRAVVMPAYKNKLNEEELALLVSFYHGISGTIRPADPAVAQGFKVAESNGCFSCHGMGGRFDLPNPGSLVGRIPAWHGDDFAELAQNEGEIRAWILDGAPERLKLNPIAGFFLKRQTVQMPAYRNLISEEDLEAILAYIRWLRLPYAPDHRPSFNEPELIDMDSMPY